MPWIIFAGLIVFGASGIAAGFEGAPRRTVDIAYDGAAPPSWRPLMQGLPIGATVFAIGLAVQVFGVLRTLIGRADVPVAKNDVALDRATPSTLR